MKVKIMWEHENFKFDGDWYGFVASCNKKLFRGSAKIFCEGSVFGIDGGKISKIYFSEKTTAKLRPLLCNYDRGWDIVPVEDDAKEVLNAIVQQVEKYAVTTNLNC